MRKTLYFAASLFLVIATLIATQSFARLTNPSSSGGFTDGQVITVGNPLIVGGSSTSTIYGNGSTSIIGTSLSVHAPDENNTLDCIGCVAFGSVNSVASTSNYSFIAGFNNNISQGRYSVAIGNQNTTGGNPGTGDEAVALGFNNIARGAYSFAIGGSNTVSSTAISDVTGTGAIGIDNSVQTAGSVAIGENNRINDDETGAINGFALGVNNNVTGTRVFGLGSHTSVNTNNAMMLGFGINGSNKLSNTLAGSIMFGSNSTIPTLTITQGSGAGTLGKIGIGTTTPATLLHIAGDFRVDANSIFRSNVNATGTAATVTACGSSPSIVGTGFAGKVTTGTNVTSTCTVVFPTGYTNAPVCTVTSNTTSSIGYKVAVTTSTLVISTASSSAFISNQLSYICLGL